MQGDDWQAVYEDRLRVPGAIRFIARVCVMEIHVLASQDDVRPAGATKRGRKTTSGPPAPPSAAD
jgi:hypothetical protein